MKAERDTDKSGGVGTYHIIEGTGKYKEVIGKNVHIPLPSLMR